MSAFDRKRWNRFYHERASYEFPQPDPLLFVYTPPMLSGFGARALDLAGGCGQNGLWLAEQGYVVDVVDISRPALVRGHEEMNRRELRTLNFLEHDLDTGDVHPHRELVRRAFDIICVFRFLKRDLIPKIRSAVVPDGRIIYETYNEGYLKIKPDMNPDYLLRPGELGGYFADWRILHNVEERYYSQLVALKPDV